LGRNAAATGANPAAGHRRLYEDRPYLILVGGTGTGKTHLATALGVAAIHRGKRVRFYNAVDLVNQLEREKQQGKARQTFLDKRKNITRVVWPNGGSPDAEAMWTDAGGITPTTVKGKLLHAALKKIVKADGFDDALLNKFRIPNGYTLAPDLKILIEEALAGEILA
jgi:hypothetical protein